MYVLTKYCLFYSEELSFRCLVGAKAGGEEEKERDLPMRDSLTGNESSLLEVEPLLSKKRKRSESRKRKVGMSLIPEG